MEDYCLKNGFHRHHVQFVGGMTKSELFRLMKMRPSTTIYHTDIIAKHAGHNAPRLPIAHCKLNPIELVWTQVKVYTA